MSRRSSRGVDERGKADMHLHTLYSDGTADVAALLDHVERSTDLDVVAIADHERIDGALRAREIHADGGYTYELVVGEEITTRRGHLLALFVEERIPPLRPIGETLERIHDQGGLAIAAHPMAPLTPSLGRRTLLELHHDPDPRHHLDAIEIMNPSPAGRARRLERHHLNESVLHLPGVGNSDAHVLEHVGTAWTWFDGWTAADYRRAVLEHAVEADGEHWGHWHNITVYGRQLAAKARHLRHTLRPTGEWR
ncbi:MAG TPA: PHP-associated domain-containing protein [Candidatus Limnocylindria bacterium]